MLTRFHQRYVPESIKERTSPILVSRAVNIFNEILMDLYGLENMKIPNAKNWKANKKVISKCKSFFRYDDIQRCVMLIYIPLTSDQSNKMCDYFT